MNEIEFRANCAQSYRRRPDWIIIDTQWSWCVNTGLWETASWTGGNVIAWVKVHEDLIKEIESNKGRR
ncbi:hypothetical protein LCGC14_1751280 [marine sediment metagenome]|uniref:Uncharacterized protein n=1 Tax=marine sediment metagenome TaxID=412755 RepID=A0A0F9H3Q2_9ZZZZ